MVFLTHRRGARAGRDPELTAAGVKNDVEFLLIDFDYSVKGSQTLILISE